MDSYKKEFIRKTVVEIDNNTLTENFPFFGFYREGTPVVCFTECATKHDDMWYSVDGENLLDENDRPVVDIDEVEIFAPDYDTIFDWYYGDIQ